MKKKLSHHLLLGGLSATTIFAGASDAQASLFFYEFSRQTLNTVESRFSGTIDITGNYRVTVAGAGGGTMYVGHPGGDGPIGNDISGVGGVGALFVADIFLSAGTSFGGLVGEDGRDDYERNVPRFGQFDPSSPLYGGINPRQQSNHWGGGGGGGSYLDFSGLAGSSRITVGGGGGASYRQNGGDGRAESLGGDGADGTGFRSAGSRGGSGSGLGGGAGYDVNNTYGRVNRTTCYYGCNAYGGGGGASIGRSFGGTVGYNINAAGLGGFSSNGQGGRVPGGRDFNSYLPGNEQSYFGENYALGDAFLFAASQNDPDFDFGKYGGHGGYGGGGGGYSGGGGGGGLFGGGGGGPSFLDVSGYFQGTYQGSSPSSIGFGGGGGGGGGSGYFSHTNGPNIIDGLVGPAQLTTGGAINGAFVSLQLLAAPSTSVPEPGTLGLFGSALALLGFGAHRRRPS